MYNGHLNIISLYMATDIEQKLILFLYLNYNGTMERLKGSNMFVSVWSRVTKWR